jgi:hypothetical protein
LLSTAMLAAVLTLSLAGAALAQMATPAAPAGMGPQDVSGAFPNHFHKGTCDNLDPQPAIVLADLHFPDWVIAVMGGTPTDTATTMPNPADFGNAPIPVAVATTEVPQPIADLISGGYALNVHSSQDISVYIACGNVGGVPDERGDLFLGLGELNGSGYSGTAWLHDNGNSTTVVVFLAHTPAQAVIAMGLAAMAAQATPMAGAAASPMAGAATTGGAAATPMAEGTPVV